MKRIHINQIKEYIGKQVKIAGFIQTIRDQGSIKFFLIRDISGIIQVVITKDEAEAIKTAAELSLESVVEIIGLAKTEKQAPGGFEVAVKTISILSLSNPEIPIHVIEKGQQEETDQQIRLDWRWIDLRKPEKALIFKVWTIMEQAFRNYCIENGFIEIHSPKLTATATESGSELFEVKYFEKKAQPAAIAICLYNCGDWAR